MFLRKIRGIVRVFNGERNRNTNIEIHERHVNFGEVNMLEKYHK